MNTLCKTSIIASIVLTGGLALARGPMSGADGGCPMGDLGMMGHAAMGMHNGKMAMDPARMQAMMERHHAALKQQLGITAAQEPAWNAFVQAHKPPTGAMQPAAQMQDWAKLSVPERLDKMQAMRQQRRAEMDKWMDERIQATKALYAALTPEQQKIFDDHAMNPRHDMGKMRHGPRGHGPHGGAQPS